MTEQINAGKENLTPRERIEIMRQQFDEELQYVLEEMTVWDFRLATAYEEDRHTGKETHKQLANEARTALNELWTYHSDFIIVSGVWDISRPQFTSRGMDYNESTDEPVFTPAISGGFQVAYYDTSAPRVGFSFETGGATVSNKNIKAPILALGFALPEKASLSFARREGEFQSSPDELIQAVRYYDGLLKLYTEQSSDFYRKSARLQQHFFQQIIDDLTESITVPGYETFCDFAEVPYLYRRGKNETPDRQGLSLEYIQDESKSILLSGYIKGVTVLESLYATDTQLRSKDDLIDTDAGICFVIKPTEGSLDGERVDDRDLLVPARLIKELHITIK